MSGRRERACEGSAEESERKRRDIERERKGERAGGEREGVGVRGELRERGRERTRGRIVEERERAGEGNSALYIGPYTYKVVYIGIYI